MLPVVSEARKGLTAWSRCARPACPCALTGVRTRAGERDPRVFSVHVCQRGHSPSCLRASSGRLRSRHDMIRAVAGT